MDARTMRVDNGSRIKLAQGSSWLKASFFRFLPAWTMAQGSSWIKAICVLFWCASISK